MSNMNLYQVFKNEFSEIKKIINRYYYGDNPINDDLLQLEEALKADSFERTLPLIDKICNWSYKAHSEISRTGYNYEIKEHDQLREKLFSIKRQLCDSKLETDVQEEEKGKKLIKNKVFIVHGHDDSAKLEVARTIEQLELEAVILHEQADSGKTIIEKLEDHAREASYAIIIYTGCDIGRPKDKEETENRYRARQNVVFEHGLFIGKLGRGNVCALIKGNVETPGDIDGVVYISMIDDGWKIDLASNLDVAGFEVDLNKLKKNN